ncbi:hypothetical protein BUALT_Bualt16G0081500 [Buddleja alternifolia]|uniref:SWIM-type domain-containing protein n=1 Tax=Buddleja alternifolia TaxID=168488 RepID=A0AAV6WHS5_9LAMI|nr:hypothetical protein BUALT_Bualt16G0081500 [Buddleja alternifolia]
MATVAAEMMFGCVFDGSLSMCDTDIERRPYHRNCTCALHKMKGKCSHVGSQHRNISFPKRELTNNFSFSISASHSSSYVHNSSTRSTRDCISEGSGKR